MNNPNEKKDFEELAALIDACMNNGSGHLNVKAGEISEIKNVATASCEGGACSSPTLHKDIDDE
ncbi:MAG: hypothetical protein IJ366_06145 [Clostridia bacterium]|nr:hypothetical protein [Clostridia bacterium]